ncbi:MAG: hypothetical protein AB1806_03245 [Acidobacteriota bacterium]
MTCEKCRAAIVGLWAPAALVPAEARWHLETCGDCRAWASAFDEGMALSGAQHEGLTAGVLGRTSGGACRRARELMAGRPETPLPDLDEALVAGHLAHCAACAEMSSVLEFARAGLPHLAVLDPGPGFAEGVIARTSRRSRRTTLAERWHRIQRRLVKRPRLAWEVAYVATICWLVFFGPPVAALEWTSTTVAAVAREHVPSTLDAVGQTIGEWRTAVGSELGTASAVVERHRGSWSESVAIALQAGIEWARKTAAAVFDGLESAVQATVTRFRGFFGRQAALPTEPPTREARSPE